MENWSNLKKYEEENFSKPEMLQRKIDRFFYLSLILGTGTAIQQHSRWEVTFDNWDMNRQRIGKLFPQINKKTLLS